MASMLQLNSESTSAKERQEPTAKVGSLTKTLDHLEWMREQMLTPQRARTGGVGQTRTANSEAHYEIEDQAVLIWHLSPHFGHSTCSKSTRLTRSGVIVNPHLGQVLSSEA